MKKAIFIFLVFALLTAFVAGCAKPTMESSPATYDNLITANMGERNASAKYKAFAQVAKEEGNVNAEKMFLAAQEAESIHAKKQYDIANEMQPTEVYVAKEVVTGTTMENLKTAFDGETYEYSDMYPPFYEEAKIEKNKPAEKIFKYAMKAEQQHALLFSQLLAQPLEDGETYFLCPVCGNIEKGKAPMFCSVCGSLGATFQAF